MDIVYELAENIVKTKHDNLTEESIEVAKRFILDSLGVLIAGSGAPGAREVVAEVKDWGGKEESSILAYGGRVPAPNAALANSVMLASLDFDDNDDIGGAHTFASILPTALACAEKQGKISGRDFILAVVLGEDLVCRLGSSLKLYRGWHYSSVCGGFGAAATASKILGLDQEHTVNALGIVYSMISGNLQCVRDNAFTKRMQPAFSSKAGIMSALLAKRGVIGAKNVMEGQYGFFNLYDTGPGEIRKREGFEYGFHALKENLGKRFEIVRLSMKPYPCCRANHAAIDATLNLVFDNDIKPENVKRITVVVPKLTFERVGKHIVVDEGLMQTKAQFSIPYNVAVAICKRGVFIDDFQENEIRNPIVLDLSNRVEVVMDPKFKDLLPVKVEIETLDGMLFSKIVNTLIGGPGKPLSYEERITKFRRCLPYSVKPISSENIERVILLVNELEAVDNINEITSLLT